MGDRQELAAADGGYLGVGSVRSVTVSARQTWLSRNLNARWWSGCYGRYLLFPRMSSLRRPLEMHAWRQVDAAAPTPARSPSSPALPQAMHAQGDLSEQ